jgi:hypothetical protein
MAASYPFSYSTQVCYALTLSHTGQGSDPTASPVKSPACAIDGQYVAGEAISLSGAAPAVGWQIASWTGTADDASTAATNSLTMPAAAHTASVNYSQICYTLTTAVAPPGVGSISANPLPNCNGGTQYTHGTVVELTASPNAGYAFTNWSGDASGATNPVSVTMDAARSVTANFGLGAYYALSVSKTGTGSGTVTSNPAGIACGATCSYAFAEDTVVTLTAMPATGSTFAGWSGAGCTGAGVCTVTMDAARSVTASFTLNTYTLTVSKTGAGSGTVTSTPAGIACGGACSYAFAYNTLVTLTATPATGSTFAGWSGAGCTGAGACTVTMDAAKSVTASFTLKT